MPQEPPPVCDYEGSDYQAEFWDGGAREYEDRVEAVALRRLLPSGGERLLEVGAGAGRNTARYAGFKQVVLLDYSRSQLEQAQVRLGKDERYLFVVGDVYRMPFQPAFDAATMIRTLHHMAEPRQALSEVRGALRSGAPFVLEYPNKRNLKAIARWLARRQTWSPFTLEPVEFARLNFDFHPRQVRRWLAEAGFRVRRQLTVSHFRARILKQLVPLWLLVGLDSIAQWTGNFWQLSPSVFVLARSVGPDAAPGGGLWRCPECRSIEMHPVAEVLACGQCGRNWGLKDGIWDFKDPTSRGG